MKYQVAHKRIAFEVPVNRLSDTGLYSIECKSKGLSQVCLLIEQQAAAFMQHH